MFAEYLASGTTSVVIEQVEIYKCLGIVTDSTFSWKKNSGNRRDVTAAGHVVETQHWWTNKHKARPQHCSAQHKRQGPADSIFMILFLD